jgi:hypothetical protein
MRTSVRHGPRPPRRPRRARALAAPDRRGARLCAGDGPLMAAPPRAQHQRAAGPAVGASGRPVRAARTCELRGRRREGPLLRLPVGGGRRPTAPGQGAARRGGGRLLRPLRLRPEPSGAAVPPRGPGGEAVRAWGPRAVAGHRPLAGGGAEVRAALRELPCGGRRRPCGATLPARRPARCRCARSGVAQWQSNRLLTDRLWVRVPPPELERRPRTAGPSPSSG